jgi:NAD(P)H dehydrogenase (quinone)
MVRREDDRAAAVRAVGAEVGVGDLLEPADVYGAVSGCRRVYFGMSVSAGYLGTGAEEGGIAGAPDPASADDGGVAPGGSV